MAFFIKPASTPPAIYRGVDIFVIGYALPENWNELFEMEVLATSWFTASECVERYLMGAAND